MRLANNNCNNVSLTLCNKVMDCVNRNLTRLANNQSNDFVNFCEATAVCINGQLQLISEGSPTLLTYFDDAVTEYLTTLTGYSLSSTLVLSTVAGSLQWTVGGSGGGSGTVTQIDSGNGMNFTSITTTGTVAMGTPSSVSLSSTNSLSATSHTHAFAPGGTSLQYIAGNGTLTTFPLLSPFANDGLSVTSGVVKLGQSIGAVGNPAGLTEHREIPVDFFEIIINNRNAVPYGTTNPSSITIHCVQDPYLRFEAKQGGSIDFNMLALPAESAFPALTWSHNGSMNSYLGLNWTPTDKHYDIAISSDLGGIAFQRLFSVTPGIAWFDYDGTIILGQQGTQRVTFGYNTVTLANLKAYITTAPSTITSAALQLDAGVAPTGGNLKNGQIWHQTDNHLYARLSGTTYQLDQQTTIYTGDGSLSSDRTVDLNSKFLKFEEGGNDFLRINPTVGSEQVFLQSSNSTGGGNNAGINSSVSNGNAETELVASFNGNAKLSYIDMQADATGATLLIKSDIIYLSSTLAGSVNGYVWTLINNATGEGAWATLPASGVSSVSGTTNRITSTGGTTPVIDISAAYVGQTSITTLGTITTGGLGTGATLGSVTVNIASSAVGDMWYAGASNVMTRLADVATGSYLRSGGVTTAPLWSTLILPNSATVNRIVYASSTNTYGESANLTFDGNIFTETSGVTTGTTTSSAHVLSVNSLTNGTGLYVASSTIQAGNLLQLVSTSTALAANNEMLDIVVSGANGTNAITATGIRSTVTNTNGTSGTNIAGQFNASGATTNNWALFTGSATGADGRINVNNATNVANQVMVIKSLTNTAGDGIVIRANNETASLQIGYQTIATTGGMILSTSSTGVQVSARMYIGASGTAPLALLHLLGGTTAASSAPLKFTSGTNMTTAEAGSVEYDGSNLYFTPTGTIRKTIATNIVSRTTAATAAVASVATQTVGAADASYIVSANVLVTTATTHSFNVTVAYTDEGNTARTATLNFSTLAGVISNAAITNVAGAVPYEGVPLHIRAKASTTITIATTGTFTTVTYNVEGRISQIN